LTLICEKNRSHHYINDEVLKTEKREREWSALKSLRKRKDIVIKAADKGGALVVWRTDLYQKEALRQLSDTSFYQKVDKDLTSINQNTVKILLTNSEIPVKDFCFYNFRLKSKNNLALNPNLLKAVNQNMPSSAVSDGKKKKEALADVVEKADGKRKKEKKEEKDDKFCKPGEGKLQDL